MILTIPPWTGACILVLFASAYLLVFAEEKLQLKKSLPVMVAAGLIWILLGLAFHLNGQTDQIAPHLRHVLIEYAELFLFLLSAMSFVNTMVERGVFNALRARLLAAKLSQRGLFWLTGLLAFFLSPVADNLTTALVMGTVVVAIGEKKRDFVAAGCVNIVIAANAGGAFSPFGDITTLMIWQKGVVNFTEFFVLFLPALVNWLVPATLLSLSVPKGPAPSSSKKAEIQTGGFVIVGLFLGTIAMTVSLDHLLGLPPFLGMMTGLGILKIYGYFLHRLEEKSFAAALLDQAQTLLQASSADPAKPSRKPFDIFAIIQKVEWDTLLFFYGIMLCVGGLHTAGYLTGLSDLLYKGLGATEANISIGMLSAIVDNIPLTFAVLTMNPQMDHGQWLLITLTAGVGGSLLSIGSAAGVALMGAAKGAYTFMSHLKWVWAILLGYAASIATHLWLNAALFEEWPLAHLMP